MNPPAPRRSSRVAKRTAGATSAMPPADDDVPAAAPQPAPSSKRRRTSSKKAAVDKEAPAVKGGPKEEAPEEEDTAQHEQVAEESVPAKKGKAKQQQKKKKAAPSAAKKSSKTTAKSSASGKKEEAGASAADAPPAPANPIYPPQHADVPYAPVPAHVTRLVSWNVTSFRSIAKSGVLQAYLAREAPHVLLLQETKMTPEAVEKQFEPLEGYSVHWFHSERKGYSGVAAVVRADFTGSVDGVDRGMGDEMADSEGRVLTLRLRTAGDKQWRIVVAYVPNAGGKLARLDYRTTVFEPALRDFLQGLVNDAGPVVYCGDLNVAHREIDIHNSKGNAKSAGHTPQEREQFGKLLEHGDKWVDCYRHLYEDFPGYTYYSKRFGDRMKLTGKGWRLDYFLLDSATHHKKCVIDCFVRQDVEGSDHYPLVLDLDTSKL